MLRHEVRRKLGRARFLNYSSAFLKGQTVHGTFESSDQIAFEEAPNCEHYVNKTLIRRAIGIGKREEKLK